MTRYLLDTNIISNATKHEPSKELLAWLGGQADTDLFIPALAIAEIWRGILQKSPGRKRRDLEKWFAGPEGPQALFAGRVLAFDERAAIEWGRIMAAGTKAGQPRSALDMIIAAIAMTTECVLVTDNERDFQNVIACLNPLRPSALPR